MDNAEVEARVKAVIVEVLKVKEEALTSQARFKQDLGADSLDLVTLLMALESEINASISDEQASAMSTVEDAVNMVGRLVNEK